MSEKSAKMVGSKPGAGARAGDAGMTEAVVQAALLRVGQDGVRLRRFLERLLRLVIAGIAIGMEFQRELAIRALDLYIASRPWPHQGLRSNHACSRRSALCHFHHRRPQKTVAEHVAAAEFFDDLSVVPVFGRLVRHRLVIVRIELGAECLDWFHATAPQDVLQLAVDELHALAIGLRPFGARLSAQRALEVIDERQQFVNDVERGRLLERLPLALGALAEVVELRGLTQKQVSVFVALLFGIPVRGSAPAQPASRLGPAKAGLYRLRVWRPRRPRTGCRFCGLVRWLSRRRPVRYLSDVSSLTRRSCRSFG